MAICVLCPPSAPARALLRRPKTLQPVCKECFYLVFETEIHNTIMGQSQAEFQKYSMTASPEEPTSIVHEGKEKRDGKGKGLFRRGERVAIGASGGKGKPVAFYEDKELR
jgi:cytoplasmic tRNA 2-thiolation protein 1